MHAVVDRVLAVVVIILVLCGSASETKHEPTIAPEAWQIIREMNDVSISRMHSSLGSPSGSSSYAGLSAGGGGVGNGGTGSGSTD